MLGQHLLLVKLYHGAHLVLSKKIRICDIKYRIYSQTGWFEFERLPVEVQDFEKLLVTLEEFREITSN
jgi:hypothetical protein